MANSKLIIVEGPQGAGKTTVTDFIRHGLKYTNLYRLCGTADSSPSGKLKAKDMYFDLIEYMKKMENKSINLLFDRTFFTEEIYSRLKFKQYDFSDAYESLLENFSALDFDIYYITLYLNDTSLFAKRLLTIFLMASPQYSSIVLGLYLVYHDFPTSSSAISIKPPIFNN